MTVVWTGTERERRAQAFHDANPHVFAKLLEIARDLRQRGVAKAGVKLLFERLRWISQVETSGDAYRLNNSFTAWYARRLMAHDPSLAGLFDTRASAHDPEFHERVVRKAARVLRSCRRDPAPSTPRAAQPRTGSLPF